MNTSMMKSPVATEQFKAAGNELLELLQREGISNHLPLTRDASLPHFSKLDSETQKQTLMRIEMMVSLCKQTMASGASIASPSAILETFFQNTGLSSIEGLFENVQEDDSIELFDTTHQLVFANLRVFQVVSYPLEELFCRPWTDLLGRDRPEINESLLKLGNEMLTGKRTKLTSTAVSPDHVCHEKDSPLMKVFEVIPNFFAPVYHGGAIAGYLCSNNLKLVPGKAT